ncbi:hypothetical protein CRE_02329 [Caenorhabditis remanei]|uniref:Uncharacterized protein n=1 Tax=Caenorhabditis remanei TaxID=31234 RepID=E3MIH9_CAERE|nr:hypothetical protein CRE_02329 [Caenorhabditis remanei]
MGKLEYDKKCATNPDETKKLSRQFENLISHKIIIFILTRVTSRPVSARLTNNSSSQRRTENGKRIDDRTAQMDPDQEQHGFDDVTTVTKHLNDYQIILWSIEGRQTVPINPSSLAYSTKMVIECVRSLASRSASTAKTE